MKLYFKLRRAFCVGRDDRAGRGKTQLMPKMPIGSFLRSRCQNRLRMLKKAVQEGRSERGREAYASVR